MRILAFSDIHGSYDRTMALIRKVSDADLIVVAGDLTTCGDFEEAAGAIRRLQATGIPVLMVGGNMDPPEVESAMVDAGVSLNARGVLVGDTGLFGVSGAPFSPLHTPNELSEDEILALSMRGWGEVKDASLRIYVPHAPPFNTGVDRLSSGRHVGSTAVREFIDQHQPDVVLCGHIHEGRGEDRLGNTVVVNCGPVALGCSVVVTVGGTITVERGL